MSLEKKEDTESLEETKEKKVIETVYVKEVDTGTVLDRAKIAPEPVEVAYVQGRLLGKVALVTGGSLGLGNGIARRFAREGAKVCFTYNTNKDLARKTVNEIEEFGEEAMCTQCDVRDSERIFKVVEETEASYGSVDILVNNAGSFDVNLVVDIPLEKWRDTFRIHVEAAFLFSKAVLKNMKRGGRIINMSSISGVKGNGVTSSYSCAKAAINAFTQALATEVASKGITVNAIAPGITNVGMGDSWLKMLPELYKTIPVKRIGKVEDIAALAAFLASPEASYITGQIIVVDGGWTLIQAGCDTALQLLGL
ncbi:MAG: SDR family NAD(P)-dependent oxidoreductase [Candidatus Lokiarchaeia archaeon]